MGKRKDERFAQDIQEDAKGERLVELNNQEFEETVDLKVNEEDGVEETHVNYNPRKANPMFWGNIGDKHDGIDWSK